MKKAFTMLELVFVIVIIGILASVAMPKLGVTRDDAVITRAQSTLSSIRSAISQEAQRRQMEGNYTLIKNVGGTIGDAGANKPIFDYFDTNDDGTPPENAQRVLEYAPLACKDNTTTGCWKRTGSNTYEYKLPALLSSENAKFIVQNNRFECNDGGNEDVKKACRILEH